MGRIKIEVQHVGGEIDECYSAKVANAELLTERHEIHDTILNGLVRYKAVTLLGKGETTIIPANDIMRIEITEIEDKEPAKIEVKQA